MTSNSRQTNKNEMTIDLPETPDNVNNTNIGRYIAIILSRVAICRRRPAKRKKHKQLTFLSLNQMHWLIKKWNILNEILVIENTSQIRGNSINVVILNKIYYLKIIQTIF